MDRDGSTCDTRSGGCQCGGIRYEIAGTPVETYICHCVECQKQSASAFGVSVIVRSDDFRITAGKPSRWSRPTDSGGTLDCFFCPDCGTRIHHGDPVTLSEISVKGGSFDRPLDLTAVPHIWVSRKRPGVQIPADVPTYDEEPE